MNILIIDDDSDDITLFCEAVHEVFPKAVCTAINSCKDVDSEISNLPVQEVIFLDGHMFPGGAECLQILKSLTDPERTRIFIHTGAISPGEGEELKMLGASGILTKAASYDAIKVALKDLFS